MNLSEFLSSQINSNVWLTEISFLIPAWKWVALLAGVFLGLILQRVFYYVVKSYKTSPRLLPRLSRGFEYFFKLPIEKSTSWTLVILIWLAGSKSLALPDGGQSALKLALSFLLAFHLIKLAYFAVEAFGQLMTDLVKKTETELDDQLVPFAVKTLKILVVILGVLLLLQNNGINVISLLAGLGLGGLALALAAQDTAANVFGSITILADRPFKVGDYVKIGGTEGLIEEIGFRSTRIRTFYDSLVSIPNATVAKEIIDNMGLRPRRRLRHDLGLTYDTPPTKIEAFCGQVSLFLKQHPQIDPNDVIVEFIAMGDFSLTIRINCYTPVMSLKEELEVQGQVLRQCLLIAEDLGVEFAFPTHTIYSKGAPSGPLS